MSSTSQPTASEPVAPRGLGPTLDYMSRNKIDVGLWMTRLLTITFTILYIIPLFGVNPYTCYQRALISNAATSALRLHQRLPSVQLTREFLAMLLLEDSCHYLFYSIIFLNAYPITLVLLPVVLYAMLHSASYTLTLLDFMGQTAMSGTRVLVSFVENQQRNSLRLVAFTEIFLMFFTISMIFFGRMSLLTPFIYYRFLTLRYASRRNPYTRQTFHELRLLVEAQVAKPGVPAGVRNMVHKMIAFISRLSPTPAQ